MAYEEYKNSGRCLGKILYQLHVLGVPLRIVEEVRQASVGPALIYSGRVFATYVWNEKDTPIFSFVPPYDNYCSLKQDPVYAVFESLDYGETYQVKLHFSFENPCIEPDGMLFRTYLVYNKAGDMVDADLKPYVKPSSTISEMAAKLAGKFH